MMKRLMELEKVTHKYYSLPYSYYCKYRAVSGHVPSNKEMEALIHEVIAYNEKKDEVYERLINDVG